MTAETSTATTRPQCGATASVNCPVPAPTSMTTERSSRPRRRSSATSAAAPACIFASYRPAWPGSRVSRPALATSSNSQPGSAPRDTVLMAAVSPKPAARRYAREMVLAQHAAALEMLGSQAVRSPRRERLIAERERACGVAFPASVVASFALDGAEQLFHDNSNEDDLVALEELGDPEETRHGYLQVALENQAVVAFYVRLDEGEDPPVYDNNDEFLEEQLDRVEWQLVSVSFTNFMFDMVCINRLRARQRDLYLQATA